MKVTVYTWSDPYGIVVDCGDERDNKDEDYDDRDIEEEDPWDYEDDKRKKREEREEREKRRQEELKQKYCNFDTDENTEIDVIPRRDVKPYEDTYHEDPYSNNYSTEYDITFS